MKRERDEHKIAAANASVSELEAHKARAELDQDKRALHDAIQVTRAPTPAVLIIATAGCRRMKKTFERQARPCERKSGSAITYMDRCGSLDLSSCARLRALSLSCVGHA